MGGNLLCTRVGQKYGSEKKKGKKAESLLDCTLIRSATLRLA